MQIQSPKLILNCFVDRCACVQISALATQPTQITILYSEASMLFQPWMSLDMAYATYTLAHFLGVQIAFVPEVDFEVCIGTGVMP